MSDLSLGTGRRIITPKVGGHLAGYGWDVFSNSIHDDLTITAFSFSQGNDRFILISATVCLIGNEVFKAITSGIFEKYGVPEEKVMIAAIHTHSGPYTYTTVGWGEKDEEYCNEILIPKALEAVSDALESERTVEVGISSIESKIGINRREYGPDGEVILGQNPWGHFDPEMTVVSFRGVEGSNVANIIHYGCHATASGTNHEVTRDWPGPMIDRLEKETGAITIFLNGAAGDVGPRISNGKTTGDGDVSYAMELGNYAALDACSAFKQIKKYRKENMQSVFGKIKIKYEELPSYEKAKELYADVPNMRIPYDNMRAHITDHYKKIIEFYESGAERENDTEINMSILKIGDIVIVPFGFELFSEIARRIKIYSKYEHTLVAGYVNESLDYLPSLDQIPRGGYEVFMFKTKGIYNLQDDTEKALIEQTLELMDKLDE